MYRGRLHNENTLIICAKDLEAPPVKYAQNNIMNPEGISMFYGAVDELTSISEIYSSSKNQITLGKFENLRELNLVDLSLIFQTETPRIFDIESRNELMLIVFLKAFVERITRRIPEESIDGIGYPSSIRKKSNCLVLFADNNCCDKDEHEVLFEKILELEKESLNTLNITYIHLNILNR